MGSGRFGIVFVLTLAAVVAGGIGLLWAAAAPDQGEGAEPAPSPAAIATRPPMRDVAPGSSVPAPASAERSSKRSGVGSEPDRGGLTGEEQLAVKNESVERSKADAFAKFDTNGDGVISAAEKASAAASWDSVKSLSPADRKWGELILDRYDVDGDGVLTEFERGRVNEYFGPLKRQIGPDVLAASDLDGDGVLLGGEKTTAGRATEAAFDRLRVFFTLDRDLSGTVEAEELRYAIAQIGAGVGLFDLNLDGSTDSSDAILAVSVAGSGG